jgi:hypothetical protein
MLSAWNGTKAGPFNVFPFFTSLLGDLFFVIVYMVSKCRFALVKVSKSEKIVKKSNTVFRDVLRKNLTEGVVLDISGKV